MVYAKKETVITSYLGTPGRILNIDGGGGFFLQYFAHKGWAFQDVEPSRAAKRLLDLATQPLTEPRAVYLMTLFSGVRPALNVCTQCPATPARSRS